MTNESARINKDAFKKLPINSFFYSLNYFLEHLDPSIPACLEHCQLQYQPLFGAMIWYVCEHIEKSG